MRSLLAATLLVAALPALAHSPYAGEQSRDIKSLSEDEVAAYLEGKGQGFARPAELNGFPGPMHVLELAKALELTPEQRDATQRLMDRHKEEARSLGRQYIEAERALDKLFATRHATPEAVSRAVRRSAELQARIRASHLTTHLEQARLLQPDQVRRYSVLRGYGDGAPPRDHRHHH